MPRWRRIADAPDPYVHRVLVRESITRWRRRRWRGQSTDRFPERGGAGHDHVVVGREALRAALMSLTPKQRAVVVLRYVEDRGERETADLLGVAVGTVKSNTRDALARLRERLPALEDLEVT